VAARGYGTLAAGWGEKRRLVRDCQAGDPSALDRVPGFCQLAGREGRPYWMLLGPAGLLIPCRGPAGEVRGLRVRRDDAGPAGKDKYRWLSTADRPGGAGSGVHCHVARPVSGFLRDRAVWVTEGELKADLAAQRLAAVVVSIPGAGPGLWPRALPDLAELLPGGGRVVVAMDSDWRTNPAVHGAAWALAQVCQGIGYEVELATWPTSHKGLDDLLVAGLLPVREPADRFPAPKVWARKLRSGVLTTLPAQETAKVLSLPEMRARLPGALLGLWGGEPPPGREP
jgi:hypothetical protein